LIGHVSNTLKDLWLRDPWLVVKFIGVTLTLGAIGKLMMVAVKDGADLSVMYVQFVPTLPMMVLTFLVHRYLWEHREASFWSYVGGCWTASYGVQFIVGHGLFILLAVLLGWQYIAVSVLVGAISAVVTFTFNQWKVFPSQESETEMP
jgi:hypothetical protein